MAIVKKKKEAKFTRILALGEDKVAQIDAMLFKNIEAVRIAKHIQNVWGDYKDVETNTLAKQIKRYRADEVIGRWLVNITDSDGKVKDGYMETMHEAKSQLNAHDLLQDLVIIQQERLNKVYLREKVLPTNMDVVRRDIDTYGKLLGQLAGIQMDLGYITRVPLKIQNEVKPLDPSVVYEATRVAEEIEAKDAQVVLDSKLLAIINSNND